MVKQYVLLTKKIIFLKIFIYYIDALKEEYKKIYEVLEK